MIISLLLSVFLSFVNFMIGLLPTTGLPAGIVSGVNGFFQYVYQFNGFFPIDMAITMIGYTAVFWGIIFAWDASHWIIRLIRGQ